MADADKSLWSSILGTAGSLIGLGSQALSNDGAKIKSDADLALLKLKNQGALSDHEYQEALIQIQTTQATKLSALKLQERKQLYAAVGVLVAVGSIAAVIILLIVRSSPRR